MATQTSVSSTLTEAVAGMVYDSRGDSVIMSYASEESSAEIPFGVMVKQGTDDQGALALTATSNKLIGVVVFQQHYGKPEELGDDGLLPGVMFGVMRRGRIWVQVEEAVTPASSVLVRAVVAGSEVAGAFRDTADSSDCIDISQCARYLTTAGAGELAVLDFDLSNFGADVAD